MKKLILSAFAMSLCLLSALAFGQAESVDDFLGLEVEILPELKGSQRFTPQDFNKNRPDWNIQPREVEMDKKPFKDQPYSLIPWVGIDPENWLSIDQWLLERKLKDTKPDWKIHKREVEKQEVVGKILQCKGKCFIYRGTKPVSATHLSRIVEGDEIKTDADSVAWIFLIDGAIVRLAPKTSLTMLEINIGESQTFYHGRLNEGHVFWNSRVREVFEFDNEPETDSFSLPLIVREANQEFYERMDYQSQNDTQRFSAIMEINDKAITSQSIAAKKLWEQNNALDIPPTNVLMSTPNGTFFSSNGQFNLFYNVGGETHFKQRDLPNSYVFFQSRGYSNSDVPTLKQGAWYKVSPNGRELNENRDPSGDLQISELLTKRIRSIELAREMWVDKYSKPVLTSRHQHMTYTTEYGYNLWSASQLAQRVDFLFEYTRRVETTHLKSIENLTAKLEAKGNVVVKSPSDVLYRASLNHYLLGLKNRYSSRKMQVREMNDLQYYVWILKNGKL